MLFNSLRYVVFLPCVACLYFLAPKRLRWALLLAASYYFYMCWEPKYLLLIVASTAVDYVAGLLMGRADTRAKRTPYLVLSLATNLGLLFAFKYFNFFNDSARALFDRFNLFYDVPAFQVLLPVGISFYTFQTLSYTIDVFRGQRPPERHPGIFAVYVAFFPQLVAGPIERSTRLLPQFREDHRLDWPSAADGCRLMLWGFFKKLVVADRLAVFVDEVFSHPDAYHGGPVWLAAYFFTFQIYCDFSGYSDIAIGSAQLMGFRLMDNFKQPYFSETIVEFWRRWHVSLSTWFRDYLYIPLGGSRVRPVRWHVNLLIVFLISGLWHGANWTFVVWGGLHGLYYAASRWTETLRGRLTAAAGLPRAPRVHRCVRILVTFHAVALAYIFFRADRIRDAGTLLSNLFRADAAGHGLRVALSPADFAVGLVAVAVMMAVEWRWRTQDPGSGRSPLADCSRWTRRGFYYAVAMAILIFGRFGANPFIYFQF